MKSNSFPAVIAVVDDDESVRSATASLLRSCGWSVRTYVSAGELLAEIDEEDACLIVADIQMPEMDGFALLGKLKELEKEIPIVFITAYATPDVVDRIANSGAADYFSKPLDNAKFLSRVAAITGISCG